MVSVNQIEKKVVDPYNIPKKPLVKRIDRKSETTKMKGWRA